MPLQVKKTWRIWNFPANGIKFWA